MRIWPPIKPTSETVWGEARKDRVVTTAGWRPVKPATRWIRVISTASVWVTVGSMVVRRRARSSGIELILIQAREQFPAGLAIEQAGDQKAVAGLEGADRRLRLGGKEAVDGPRVISEVLQMAFRDLDLALAQEPVQRGA
jgi:hypothetical protein